MKRSILVVTAICAFTFTNAQNNNGQTAAGKWLIEANTNFGAAHPAQTSLQFSTYDGVTAWNLGLESGYFVTDDLAIKLGLAYGESKIDTGIVELNSSSFTYKIGAKYYIIGIIPIQVDYSGASIKDIDDNPSYIGFQGGYAWFLGENVSIEPGLRYNLATDSDIYENIFQLNIGFVLHF